ncbi:uncharacterized protein WM277_003416 isoform 1-T1 [Molossus nigricans]
MESRIWLRSRSESFSRRWFNPHLRRLYPFRRRSPESSAQEKGQELSDGVFNSTPPQEAQVSNTPATLQDGHHRSSAQEKGQELSDGVFNSTPPQEAQVSNTPATLQDGHHRAAGHMTEWFRSGKGAHRCAVLQLGGCTRRETEETQAVLISDLGVGLDLRSEQDSCRVQPGTGSQIKSQRDRDSLEHGAICF